MRLLSSLYRRRRSDEQRRADEQGEDDYSLTSNNSLHEELPPPRGRRSSARNRHSSSSSRSSTSSNSKKNAALLMYKYGSSASSAAAATTAAAANFSGGTLATSSGSSSSVVVMRPCSLRSTRSLVGASFSAATSSSELFLTPQARERLDALQINKLRFDRLALVGRTAEIQQIQAVFYQTLHHHQQQHQHNQKQLLWIRGAAGTGKTHLALRTLRPLVDQHRGFLLCGKHEAQPDRLYAALAACCDDFCQQVGTKLTKMEMVHFTTRLRQELGSEAALLTSIVPSLKLFFVEPGRNPNDDDDDETSQVLLGGGQRRGAGHDYESFLNAQLRFNTAFRRFLRVVCQLAPIVLLIDDVHWCDESSFQLMESLLKDFETSRLLIVGTYRPDAAVTTVPPQQQHLLAQFQQRFPVHNRSNSAQQLQLPQQQQQPPPNLVHHHHYHHHYPRRHHHHGIHAYRIDLGNLSLDAVVDLLADLLNKTRARVGPLARLVHHKTHGNAFFLVQFLTTLQHRQLLEYNLGHMGWRWDVDKIDRETRATENVADIVRARLQSLPPELQEILPFVGSLGASFTRGLFRMVMNHVRAQKKNNNKQETTDATLVRAPPPPEAALSSLSSRRQEEDDRDDERILALFVSHGFFELDRHDDGDNDHQGGGCCGATVSTATTYRWIHDKVEEGALGLVPSPDQLSNLQYELGWSLLRQMDESQVDEHIFVLNHLLRTAHTRLAWNDPQRRLIAQLKRKAGHQAFQGSDFYQATQELRDAMIVYGILPSSPTSSTTDSESTSEKITKGFEFQGDSFFDAVEEGIVEDTTATNTTVDDAVSEDVCYSPWETDYKFCLDLFSTAAEANLCTGQTDVMEDLVQEIIHKTEEKPWLDRRRAWNAKARALASKGETQKNETILLELLAQQGVKFPKTLAGGVPEIALKLLKVPKKVKTIRKKLQCLPVVQDEAQEWTFSLLAALTRQWYLSNHPLFPLVILKGFDLSLVHGICSDTPYIWAATGLLFAVGLNAPKIGKVYAEHAFCLLQSMKSKACEAKVILLSHSFIYHHTRPLEESKKEHLRGYQSGMAAGDSEYAGWNIAFLQELCFHSGKELDSMIEDCRKYTLEARELKQNMAASMMDYIWQSALNLAGRSDDPLSWNGEAMKEDEWMATSANFCGEWSLFLVEYKVHVMVIMGEHARAMDLILKNKFHQGALIQNFPGQVSTCWLNFHCALAAVSMARCSKKGNRFRFYRKMANYFAKQIKIWLRNGCPNVVHHYALIQGELADLSGDTSAAESHFEKALIQSARRGFRVDRALVHEQMAKFWARRRDKYWSQHHIKEAIQLYTEWGAVAKVEKMQQAAESHLGAHSGHLHEIT